MEQVTAENNIKLHSSIYSKDLLIFDEEVMLRQSTYPRDLLLENSSQPSNAHTFNQHVRKQDKLTTEF